MTATGVSSTLTDLTMPKLSDSMEEATIVAWLVETGHAFSRGQPLFEVETDKATVVYEADADGVLQEILVREGESAVLGAPVARATLGIDPPAEAAPPAQPRRARATPVARALAAQYGVDLAMLRGSGPGGRIVRSDIAAAAPAAGTAETTSPRLEQSRRVELSTTQKTIARRMAESRSTIPDFTLTTDVNLTSALALRREINDVLVDARVSVNDLVVKACGVALVDFPRINSSYEGDSIVEHARIDVGIAVAAGELLLVPVIRGVNSLPLVLLAAETRRLGERARERSLAPSELENGTFTVSNLGMYGVSSFHAVINSPQAAILAVGRVDRRPVFDSSGIVVAADMVALSLSCDHRVVYGADAAQFLDRVRELLERPISLVADALTNEKEKRA